MVIEILSIGADFLLGINSPQTTSILTQQLALEGVFVSRYTAVVFDQKKIKDAITEALHRRSTLIVIGSHSVYEIIEPLFLLPPKKCSNSVFQFRQDQECLILVPPDIQNFSLKETFPEFQQKRFFGMCSLCLLKEKEVVPFLQEIDTQGVEVGIYPSYGSLVLTFSSDRPVGFWIDKIAQRFPSYFLKEGTIQQAIYKEMVEKKKTLGLVESCTGGAIAARLVTVPGASSFFLGSIVAYSNDWKEKFLGLKRDTLLHTGAVSLRTVKEMIEAIFLETNVDYAIAVSGIAGPSGGTQEKKTGTIYIAVGKRGEKIDAGRIIGPQNRLGSIELSVQTALGALWRRIASNAFTLS